MTQTKSPFYKHPLRCLFKDRRVAYLPLSGVILESHVVADEASPLDLLKEIEKQDIKALVIRINSPGGTVGASQELYGALRKLADEKGVKIVASMGDVAASGGVYVAMAADYIYAQPGTVTGSIGVIIKSGNLRGLLDKIGINSEVVKSGKFKDTLSMDRALTEDEKELLQTIIDDTYDQFVRTVSKQRKLLLDDVKQFADGRIMSGRQALKYGLVDALGGQDEAILKARELAGLSLEGLPKLITVKKKKPFVQKLLKGSLLSDSVLGLKVLEQEYSLSRIPLWLMPTLG